MLTSAGEFYSVTVCFVWDRCTFVQGESAVFDSRRVFTTISRAIMFTICDMYVMKTEKCKQDFILFICNHVITVVFAHNIVIVSEKKHVINDVLLTVIGAN